MLCDRHAHGAASVREFGCEPTAASTAWTSRKPRRDVVFATVSTSSGRDLASLHIAGCEPGVILRLSSPGRGTWHAHRSQAPSRTPSRRPPPRSGARRAHDSSRRQAPRRSASTAFGRLAAPARGATAPEDRRRRRGPRRPDRRVPLRKAGYAAEIHEAVDRIGGRCWTLRGAFADGQIVEHGGELIDQGHSADPPARAGARPQARQPAPGGAERHRAARVLRRRAVHLRGDDRRHQGGVAEDPRGRLGGELPDHVRDLDRARARARQHVDRRLDRGDVRGRDRLAARPAPRRRLQHRVRRRVHRAELAQPALPARATRGQGQFRVFGPSNEKYHVVGGNDQITDRLAARLAGQITTGSELVAVRRNAAGSVHAHVRAGVGHDDRHRRQGRARAARSRSSARRSTSRRPASSR